MGIFGSKNEARIMAGAAAFFVLIALIFTFEPLLTLILRVRTLPVGTTTYMTPSPISTGKPDYFSGITKTIPSTHSWVGNAALLNKLQNLIFDFNVTSATLQAQSFAMEAQDQPSEVMTKTRRFLSKLTPYEVKTTLPDDTLMTEFVIDPELIEVKQVTAENGPGWLFTQTTPPLFIKNNGLNTTIYFTYPQDVNKATLKTLASCHLTDDRLRIVTFKSEQYSVFSSILSSIWAYVSDYSCFQSFSTYH